MHKEKLAKKIVNYMNELNRNIFTEEELKDFTCDYVCMIENNKDVLINVLKEEYTNSNDLKVLEFIKELKERGN